MHVDYFEDSDVKKKSLYKKTQNKKSEERKRRKEKLEILFPVQIMKVIGYER